MHSFLVQNKILVFIFKIIGGGPSCLPEKYHTVIELPTRRCSSNKRRSPSKWKSFFTRRGSSISLGVPPLRKKSEPNVVPFQNMVFTKINIVF